MIYAIVFFTSFSFFLSQISPTLYGGDTGEFIASSFILGIPHAPGFPLYEILSNLSIHLFPFSSTAYRVHLASALTASANLVLLLWLASKIFLSRGSKFYLLGGGLVLFFSPLFRMQAAVAEVFGLNLLFFLSILILLKFMTEETSKRHRERIFILASFLFGLGLGNHHILIVLVPFFILTLVGAKISKNALLVAGLMFTAGLGLYIYLPLRALAGPDINFGNPETLKSFLAVLFRKEFGSLSLHPAAIPFHSWSIFLEQGRQFILRNISSLGWVGGILSIWGLIWSLFIKKEFRFYAVISLLVWAFIGFGFEVYSNLSPFSSIGQWRLERFFLVPFVVYLFFVFAAFASMKEKPFLTAFIIFLLAGEGAISAKGQLDTRHLNLFRDFAISTLRLIPPHSILVIDRVLFDEPTSSLLNQVVVEKQRNDIDIYYRPGSLFGLKYGKDVLSLNWPDRFNRQKKVESDLLLENRPISFLAFEKRNALFKDPKLNALVYQDVNNQHRSRLEDSVEFIINRHPKNWRMDYQTRLMSVHFSYFLAKAYIESGRFQEAGPYLRKAMAVGYDMDWLMNNLGGVFIQNKEIELASEFFSKSLAINPYFAPAHFGMGYVSLQKNALEDAAWYYERMVRLDPTNPDGYYMLGVSYDQAQQQEQAETAWTHYLAMQPSGPQAEVIQQILKER